MTVYGIFKRIMAADTPESMAEKTVYLKINDAIKRKTELLNTKRFDAYFLSIGNIEVK